MTRSFQPHPPTESELSWAEKAFGRVEARGLFYRLATWLMERAHREEPPFTKSEALAVLLQTWNRGLYQRRRIPFDQAHFSAIEGLLSRHEASLRGFRLRPIESLVDDDEAAVRLLYRDFASVLYPTGASKALHLLATEFFPLWDAEIAPTVYHLYTRDDRDYWRLMSMVRAQVVAAGGRKAIKRNPLKAIDEYNYCRHTLKLAPP